MAQPHNKPIPELSDVDMVRFYEFVDRNPGHGPQGECWMWTGGIRRVEDGYGAFWLKGGTFTAHRIAYLIETEVDPLDNLVLHRCDWPLCCRGSHLFLGSQDDNMKDKTSKQRQAVGDRNGSRIHRERMPRGETNKNSRLKAADVRSIREQVKIGVPVALTSQMYGVSIQTIYHILKRKTWRHIL